MKIKLITHTPDPLTMIYAQARMTTTRGDFDEIYHNNASIERKIQLITDTLSSGHWSVACGVTFTFSIARVSRACSHQLVRHVQVVAWEQQSQRYKEVDTNADWFVTAPIALKDQKSLEIYQKAMQDTAKAYQDILEASLPAEDARLVLPNAARTNPVGTFSFEALKSFLVQRNHAVIPLGW